MTINIQVTKQIKVQADGVSSCDISNAGFRVKNFKHLWWPINLVTFMEGKVQDCESL
jgi:hypothetical protein